MGHEPASSGEWGICFLHGCFVQTATGSSCPFSQTLFFGCAGWPLLNHQEISQLPTCLANWAEVTNVYKSICMIDSYNSWLFGCYLNRWFNMVCHDLTWLNTTINQYRPPQKKKQLGHPGRKISATKPMHSGKGSCGVWPKESGVEWSKSCCIYRGFHKWGYPKIDGL